MIAQLRGRVAAANLGEVVLDVGGVGYRVRIPPGIRVPGAGAELTLHTHLAVREDAMTLYGFPDPAGRDLFETLLSVTGFGPKLALAALGTLGAEGLRRAVVTEDVGALTVVPGVGKKSAQRVILELRERLGAIGSDAVPGTPTGTGGGSDARLEVREALTTLGYAPAEISRALEAVTSTHPAPAGDDAAQNGQATLEAPEELLRRALRALGSR